MRIIILLTIQLEMLDVVQIELIPNNVNASNEFKFHIVF